MSKQYDFNGLAGCVSQTRARTNGRLIGIYNNKQADLDECGGPWATICEEHGHIVSHDTLALARSHAADPAGWCEQCGEAERS